ncbi:hypothetical protein MLD38_005365 [Melastoma candidum]|uniref:Uncharacterized protein n=1 Tax=Melastoma candidum TaxID=119954 RepID=A0ACB9S8Q4_9MYRT|nr:hypothetical protein MLD38_005365 [Melastoma candidum]
MACRESSRNANNCRRSSSDELDVFEATRYFSGYGDGVLASSNPDSRCLDVQNTGGRSLSRVGKEARHPSSRVTRKSLDIPMTRPYVLMQNGVDVVRAGRERGSEGRRMLRQPSSPSGKIVSFMKSLFNPSSSAGVIRAKEVKKTAMGLSLKDRDEINPGGWQRRRRSSISHFWTSSAVADSKSLPSIKRTVTSFSYVHSVSRTPPRSNTADTPRDDSASLPNHSQDALSRSERNKAMEEFAKWKVSCSVKGASNRSIAMDHDDDGNESDSSSDLFELPVYDCARLENNRRSSMSTVSAASAFAKLHV